jgi:hypothetical protein
MPSLRAPRPSPSSLQPKQDAGEMQAIKANQPNWCFLTPPNLRKYHSSLAGSAVAAELCLVGPELLKSSSTVTVRVMKKTSEAEVRTAVFVTGGYSEQKTAIIF